jgi:predicted RecA/RadA family phage recombinase
VIGALFGVASKTAAEGKTVTIATTGVFDLPKLTSTVIRRMVLKRPSAL